MSELLPYLESVTQEIDLMIDRYFIDKVGELNKASAHLLAARGKRLRPAVVMLAADAVKRGSSQEIIQAALALELTHTFTLIHDDIMDDDTLRRGVQTVHTKWDMPTGILAGDVLYARAFEFICLSKAHDNEKVHAVSMLARACADICEGQHMDMSFAHRNDVDEYEYLEMVKKKTGVLYAAAAGIGAILAGSTAHQAKALYLFGLNTGIAFQIQDDLIDLLTPAEKSGKDRASDLREGKQTLIMIKAREKGVDLQKYRRDLSDADIDAAIKELTDAGVIDEVKKVAADLVAESNKHLSLLPPSKERELLMEIGEFFVTRAIRMAGEDPKELLFLCALQNAVKHGGVPQAGAVVGMVMGAHPEFRPRAKEVAALAKEAIANVAALSSDDRIRKLQALSPEMYEALFVKHEHRKVLPDLEGAEHGVVMRFAPNPSGPLHIGHARAAVLNDAYVKQYGGRYILRIEDTDPKRVDPAAYEMVKEDIVWMGLGITETVTQSDRLPLYYDLCKQLIGRGGAYVCTCNNEHFKELKQAKTACPCRDQPVEKNLELWQKMLDHTFKEGEVTVRVKTDLNNPDPAMRDFPAFRILDSPPHPKVIAHVYPLMNFSVVADDHLLGVTHVIRGKDHIANTRRQRYIYDHFGWNVPVYRHYGRMGIEGVVLSTSQMRLGINEGTFTGWDDIRLGTLRALARRGISPDAVKNAVLAIGIGDTDISFSWDNLYAENKKIVDPVANRYFFVPDPVEITIPGAPTKEAHLLNHPSYPDRGARVQIFQGSTDISKNDLIIGQNTLRLKDLFNIKVEWDGTSVKSTSYEGDSLSAIRTMKAPIIQWVTPTETVPCTLITQEGERKGFCEKGVIKELGNVVQFERIGFVKIDAVSNDGVRAYFTHK